MTKKKDENISILYVEDNHAEVRLLKEALKEWNNKIDLFVVEDGVKAMDFLSKKGEYSQMPRPDLVLLDLNLPKKDGREVLIDIKSDDEFRNIPVVVLTTSDAPIDVQAAYENYANCYVTKPIEVLQYLNMVKTFEKFWLNIASLPNREKCRWDEP